MMCYIFVICPPSTNMILNENIEHDYRRGMEVEDNVSCHVFINCNWMLWKN